MADEPDDVDAMVEPVVPSRHRWLAGLLGARPGDRMVDLGCGTGASLTQVAPDLRGGVAVGVDASLAVLARAADELAPAVTAAVSAASPKPGARYSESSSGGPSPCPVPNAP